MFITDVSNKAAASEKHKSSASKTAKRKQTESRWQGGRADKQNYTHPWLLATLKGHTDQVLDMDFSSNGKYLATCAEEPDPGGSCKQPDDSNMTSGAAVNATTTNNHNNKENNRPPATKVNASGLSRRQRKNCRRDDASPSTEVKKKSRTKRGNCNANANTNASTNNAINITSLEGAKRPATVQQHSQQLQQQQPVLRQYLKLGLDERQLYAFLRTYLLNAEQMLSLGYPVESELHPGRAIIFKSPMTALQNHYTPYKASRFDVNAREFVPGGVPIPAPSSCVSDHQFVDYTQIKRAWHSSHGDDSVSSSPDSGHGGECSSSSDSSSEPSDAVLLEEETEDSGAGSGSDQDPSMQCSGSAVHGNFASVSEERQCVRCGHGFFVASDGEYLTQEHCTYHWGKLQRVFENGYSYQMAYSCCQAASGAAGCTVGKLHVWNGVGVGFNGPFERYVRTRPRKPPSPDGNYGVYALDCEMCYTAGGLELAKVTVVGADGRPVYDCFVRPEHDVVDYNTRFSGITARDLSRRASTKRLRDVQRDLLTFINADTILIGHGLENDLRALRLIHGTVVDTAVTFPHFNGLPYRRSLKTLSASYLKRDIQTGAGAGHNSCEDARACMELMLWRVRKDFRVILEHYQRA